MIDIIIPAYNAHSYILNALYSIASQTLSNNIKVYIVDDCSIRNYNREVKKVEKLLNITEIRTSKNIGPGGARQYGIDHSSSEYIVFLDADDQFNNGLSIKILYDFINNNNYNAVCSNFYQENENDFKYHHYNDIWMHGKIYRRSFLEKNKIRFNNTYANEDTGFNRLIAMYNGFNYIDAFTYIWKSNPNSITKRNNFEYRFKGLEGYIYNNLWAIEESEKRNVDKYKIIHYIYKIMIEMYFSYLKVAEDDNKSLEILKWLKNFKKAYDKYQNDVENENIICVENYIINEAIKEGMKTIGEKKYLYNDISFNTFLKRIDKI